MHGSFDPLRADSVKWNYRLPGEPLGNPTLNEFNIVAVPPPALARRLADLAASGVGAVLIGRDDHLEEKRYRERRAQEMDAALLELAVAVYRETQARILESFEIDRRATRLALAEIDRKMAELARERAEMIERAVKLDDGRAVFLSEDGKSIYTEDGERLSNVEAERLLAERRGDLEAGDTWERFEGNGNEHDALEAERAWIVEWDRRRDELEDKVKRGELTQEEMEKLEREYAAQVPERVREKRAQVDAGAGPSGALSADELAYAADPLAAPLLTRRFNNLADPVLAEALPVVNDPVPSAHSGPAVVPGL